MKSFFTIQFYVILNFIYIGLIKVLNIGSKFVLVGYLIRVLGENGYGTLTWVDSIVQYFIMIINFGFEIYAAKYVVEHINNTKKLNEVISTIYYIKVILLIFSFLLLIPLSFNSQINTYINLIFIMLTLGIGEVLMPIWFFQGIEKMKIITLITLITKIILIFLTFSFVNNVDDMFLYIYFLVIINFIWGLSGFVMMKREIDFKFVKISYHLIKNYFKESYMFFIGKFSAFIFNLGTLFLIGYLFSKANVAGFDISIKIIFVFIIPFEVLQQALFPKVVRGIAISELRKIIMLTFVISILTSLIIYFYSTQILYAFGGEEMVKFSYILNICLFLIPIVSLTTIISNCNMIARGHYKVYNWSIIFTSSIFIVLILLMHLSGTLNFLNLVILRVFTDLLQLLIRVYYSLKYKII